MDGYTFFDEGFFLSNNIERKGGLGLGSRKALYRIHSQMSMFKRLKTDYYQMWFSSTKKLRISTTGRHIEII